MKKKNEETVVIDTSKLSNMELLRIFKVKIGVVRINYSDSNKSKIIDVLSIISVDSNRIKIKNNRKKSLPIQISSIHSMEMTKSLAQKLNIMCPAS